MIACGRIGHPSTAPGHPAEPQPSGEHPAQDTGRLAAAPDPHGAGGAPVPGKRPDWIRVGDQAVGQVAAG